MNGFKRHYAADRGLTALAVAVTICTLLIGCDSEPAIVPTPIPAAATQAATPTSVAPDSQLRCAAFSNVQSGPIDGGPRARHGRRRSVGAEGTGICWA